MGIVTFGAEMSCCSPLPINENDLLSCEPKNPALIKSIFFPKNRQAAAYLRKKLRESGDAVNAEWIQKMVDKGTLAIITTKTNGNWANLNDPDKYRVLY